MKNSEDCRFWYIDTAGKRRCQGYCKSFKELYLEEHDPKSEVVLQPSNPDIEPETIQKDAKEHQIRLRLHHGRDG